MERRSRRWPLPRDAGEWAVDGTGMVLVGALLFLAAATSTPLAWLGWALGVAFFLWLTDLCNRRMPTRKMRLVYLLSVGAAVGLVIGLPFSK